MADADQFRFRRLDTIGAADAEEDQNYLRDCFLDTGNIRVLRDCSDPRRIILGRTGKGKTALLLRLGQGDQRVITVQAESLALAYISNSNILGFFATLGVKLDIFFKLLWRHVFTVEIIKTHFNIYDETAGRSFFAKVRDLFRDKRHVQAMEYLEKWGRSFWQETDYRIKELTTKLETDLKASVGTTLSPLSFSTESASKLTEEQKREVVERAQHVVNNVQIRELSDIIRMLDDVLEDPQKPYYVVIDRLDENWVDEKLRYRLIRALIETVRDFRNIRHAKIVVALRSDLLDRVVRLTRDVGFQEEKLESLYLPLEWTRQHLTAVLDSRIDYLVRPRYTKSGVKHSDLLPKLVDGQPTIDYILDRTMMRPRDVILFFNYCIKQAVDRPILTVEMVRQAEGEYSRDRLRSLADEWFADYANLLKFVDLLKGRPHGFRLNEIMDKECDEFCLKAVSEGFEREDDLSIAANQLVECMIPPVDFRRLYAQILYRVGLAGLKLETYETTVWSINGRRSISSAEISPDVRVSIHPVAWRTLGIQPPLTRKS